MIHRRSRYYDEFYELDRRYRYPQYPKPYGALAFTGDVLMTLFTGGLWLIWIFVREMRRRNVRY